MLYIRLMKSPLVKTTHRGPKSSLKALYAVSATGLPANLSPVLGTHIRIPKCPHPNPGPPGRILSLLVRSISFQLPMFMQTYCGNETPNHFGTDYPQRLVLTLEQPCNVLLTGVDVCLIIESKY